jgi:TPR repeat protein
MTTMAAQSELDLGLAAIKQKKWKVAFEHLQLAYNQGSMIAAVKLGQIYWHGMDTKKVNQPASLKLFEKAHKAGVDQGTIWLGFVYAWGDRKDLALQLLLPFVDKDPFASCFVAWILRSQGQSPELALSKLRPLANDGDPFAAFECGLLTSYVTGKTNARIAAEFWKIGAAQGSAPCQDCLYSALRFDGLYHEALKMCRLAANQGYAIALYHTANSFATGVDDGKFIEQGNVYVEMIFLM